MPRLDIINTYLLVFCQFQHIDSDRTLLTIPLSFGLDIRFLRYKIWIVSIVDLISQSFVDRCTVPLGRPISVTFRSYRVCCFIGETLHFTVSWTSRIGLFFRQLADPDRWIANVEAGRIFSGVKT